MDRGIWRVGDPPFVPTLARIPGRRWRWIVHLLLLAADGLLIYAAFALAYWMRFTRQWGRDVPFESYRLFEHFEPIVPPLLLLVLAMFQFKRLYRRWRHVSWLDQVGTIIGATSIAMALLVLVGSLTRQYTIYFTWSRLIFIYSWLNIIVLVSLFRLLLHLLVRWAWRHGLGVERVLVVGATGVAQQVMSALAFDGARGSRLLGFLDDPDERLVSQRSPGNRFTRLGSVDNLDELLPALGVEHVIIALPFWAHHRLPQLVATCRTRGVSFSLAPDLYEVSFDRVELDSRSGVPLITLNKNVIRGWNLALKRALDLGLIVLIAPLWMPVALFCALLIRLTSPGGPVLFRQTRVGKGGQLFEVYKFRTMVPNAEQLKDQLLAKNEADGPLFKIKADPRVTTVGRWLRKLSLDELPQLINVIKGQMSLVGPRPAIPEEVAQYTPWHQRRLEVTPGLTGLWQVMGRSDTTFDEMVRFDIYYSEHWSLWLDLRILLQTIPAVLSGRGAY